MKQWLCSDINAKQLMLNINAKQLSSCELGLAHSLLSLVKQELLIVLAGDHTLM